MAINVLSFLRIQSINNERLCKYLIQFYEFRYHYPFSDNFNPYPAE